MRGSQKSSAAGPWPGGNTMASVRKPESGVVMFMACCMAWEVSPILWPISLSPRSRRNRSQAAWTR